jgi:hypothetical protein
MHELGAEKGISVIAHDGAFFMPISFFLREKFRTIERRGHTELMSRELEPSNPPSSSNPFSLPQ